MILQRALILNLAAHHIMAVSRYGGTPAFQFKHLNENIFSICFGIKDILSHPQDKS